MLSQCGNMPQHILERSCGVGFKAWKLEHGYETGILLAEGFSSMIRNSQPQSLVVDKL